MFRPITHGTVSEGRRTVLRGAVVVTLCLGTTAARGDEFTYLDKQGEPVTVQARLAGSTQNFLALETADGQLRAVPQAAVLRRTPGPDPEPLDAKAVASSLRKQFGAKRFRVKIGTPWENSTYVVGLVLANPLPEQFDRKAKGFLNQRMRFLRNIEAQFMGYARQAQFPTRPPRYPLVVLIFESDDDFEEYAKKVGGAAVAQAGTVSGFYSVMTNYLVVRLSECDTFETPLHEAIHQQVYNRSVFERLAPVPAWFHEGIATGFEGDGEKIRGPTQISHRYARLARDAQKIDWETIICDDKAFRGNVLAGEAYGQAWGLHWLLVKRYKQQYVQYVQMLAKKRTLDSDDAAGRVAQFEKIVGVKIADLEKEFRRELANALRRHNIDLDKEFARRPAQQGLARYDIDVVRREDMDGVLVADGTLTNLSPFRPMSFYVSLETDVGTYAEWHVHALGIGGEFALPKQFATKPMEGGPGGPCGSYKIRVRSAVPDSVEARLWNQGKLPVPVFGG